MTSDKIQDLYTNKGLSAREVGTLLGVTQWQVIRMLKKYGIQRRSPAETQRIQFKKSPLSFNKLSSMIQRTKSLYEAGLMLYWAEGGKSNNGVVDFANSDERMVCIFLSMLRYVYRVNEERLRVLLYCYKNQDVDKLIRYWSNKLSIPSQQFTKPYIRQDYDAKKLHKMEYGLIHVRYNDKRLLMLILADIDIMAKKLVTC